VAFLFYSHKFFDMSLIPFPDKKYQIIYADPPWLYENRKDNNPAMGGFTYDVMSVQDMCDMPVKDIADKNCSLFIWVTMPKLQEVFPIIDAWGFKYITCAFTWIKTNPKSGGIYSGLGHWTNGNAELCLFCKKGAPKRVEKNVKQVQIHPRGRHSAKPPIIRDEIVRLVGDLPRIELFARNSAPGWDAWGNEVDASNSENTSSSSILPLWDDTP
jgi:N6-adenosine-specific RNA methylase IME4